MYIFDHCHFPHFNVMFHSPLWQIKSLHSRTSCNAAGDWGRVFCFFLVCLDLVLGSTPPPLSASHRNSAIDSTAGREFKLYFLSLKKKQKKISWPSSPSDARPTELSVFTNTKKGKLPVCPCGPRRAALCSEEKTSPARSVCLGQEDWTSRSKDVRLFFFLQGNHTCFDVQMNEQGDKEKMGEEPSQSAKDTVAFGQTENTFLTWTRRQGHTWSHDSENVIFFCFFLCFKSTLSGCRVKADQRFWS